jgi:hypothetical protein
MQSLYLDDSGTVSTNVESDVPISTPATQTETAEEISSQTLNVKKGETAMETEVPETMLCRMLQHPWHKLNN